MTSNKCPADPCDVTKGRKEKMSDAERLDKLEKEVNLLRADFDTMRWEQTVAETAIGRAIIRGSASFGISGFEMMGQRPFNCGEMKKNNQLVDNPDKKCQNSESQQLQGKKAISDGKEKNGKAECGYFTLG